MTFYRSTGPIKSTTVVTQGGHGGRTHRQHVVTLLGRKTYEIFAAYWPQGPEEIPFTALLNNAPKYVASRTLESVEWNNSNLIQGEIANEVPRLKEQYGQIHVSGSADLVQTLQRHDLVDQLNLWVYPVVLGTGKKLFADGAVPRP